MIVDNLAASGIFESGRQFAYAALGLLVLIVVVAGGAHSVKAHMREGAGSGITSTLLTIVHAALLAISIALAAGLVNWMHQHNADQQAPNSVVQPWSQ